MECPYFCPPIVAAMRVAVQTHGVPTHCTLVSSIVVAKKKRGHGTVLRGRGKVVGKGVRDVGGGGCMGPVKGQWERA
jgi:hypothetical protein